MHCADLNVKAPARTKRTPGIAWLPLRESRHSYDCEALMVEDRFWPNADGLSRAPRKSAKNFLHCTRPCGACAEGIRLQPNLPIASEPASPRHATLILLCAFSVLPLSMLLPSLPAIARDLRADYGLVALALGGYAAVAAYPSS